MEKPKRKGISDEEANQILDEILEEDRQETLNGGCSENCDDICAKHENETETETRVCECMRIALNSSRFSLRVMEAMRSLQRDSPTSSVEDIVDYVGANYRDDGDLYAQVRTAVKQVCSQGFVVELMENEYYFIGPDALSMNSTTCSNDRGDCRLSFGIRNNRRDRMLFSRENSETEDRELNRTESDSCGCEEPISKYFRTKHERQAESAPIVSDGDQEGDSSSQNATEYSSELPATDESLDRCTCGNPNARDRNTFLKSEAMQRNAGSGQRRKQGNNQTDLIKERKRHANQDTLGNGLQQEASKGNEQKRKRLRGDENREKQIAFGRAKLNASKNEDYVVQREMRNDDDDSGTIESMSESVDDIYRQINGSNVSRRSEAQEKELKSWIKRCQEQCKQERSRNN